MRRFVRLLIIPLAMIATCGRAAQADDYQRILENAVEQGVPGVQAVVLQGSREWSSVAGVASVERQGAMTAHDRIRLASITKMMTYATIMELARRGRLALSDRAVDRLPPGTLTGIPNAQVITIEQLLEHSSGLHNFNGPNGADFFRELYSDPNRGSRIWTARELLAFAARPGNRPVNAPGAQRDYSSTGYIILEMIAEHLTGQPLPSLYDRLLFQPYGMTRSGFEGFNLRGSDITPSYGRPEGPIPPASPFTGRAPVRADGLINLSAGLDYYNAWARGAGAVASTACDLGRFMRAVTDNRLVVLKDQAQIFEAARNAGTGSYNWNGGSAGIQSSIFYAPAGDVVVIVLTNGTNSGPASLEIGRTLFAAARRRAAEGVPAVESHCPAARTPLDLVQDVARHYEMFFQTGNRAAFENAFAPNGTYLTLWGDFSVPLGATTFSEAFAGWARAPDPLARVETLEVSFLGERMASMRLRLHYRGRAYLDQLGLYRLGATWRIVAKQTQPG